MMVRLGFREIVRKGKEPGWDPGRPGKRTRIEHDRDSVTKQGEAWSPLIGTELRTGWWRHCVDLDPLHAQSTAELTRKPK